MKQRVISISVILLLVIMSILSACGSSTKDYNEMAAPSAAPEMAYDTGDTKSAELGRTMEQMNLATGANNSIPPTPVQGGNSLPDQPRKIVKNGHLSLETKEFDITIPAIVKLIEDAGGYVENQSIDGVSLYQRSDYYERNGNIVARVPANKLSEITSAIGNTYNIVAQSEYVNDITDQYYDAASHLEMLKAQEKRLLELMKKADKLEDIIQLETALTDCRYQIDSLTGRLRRMDNQVSYSTLDISIREVAKYNEIDTIPKTFWEKMADSFKRSGRNIAYTLENGLFFIIEELPTLLIYLAIWAVIIFVVYKFVRKVFSKRHVQKQVVQSDIKAIEQEKPSEE